MTRIEWNKAGFRRFETGVEMGVLFPKVGPGVAWNGIVSVAESPSGGELAPLYFNGVKYMDYQSGEDFEATLEAFNSPPEFAASEGIKSLAPGLTVSQQRRVPFGLCYRTLIGNDLVGTEFGYKLHLVYNCMATPAGRSNKTLTDKADLDTRSWKISTVPPPATTYQPTAHLVLDSTIVDPYLMEQIEDFLYGRNTVPGRAGLTSRLPTIPEIVALFNNKLAATVTPNV